VGFPYPSRLGGLGSAVNSCRKCIWAYFESYRTLCTYWPYADSLSLSNGNMVLCYIWGARPRSGGLCPNAEPRLNMLLILYTVYKLSTVIIMFSTAKLELHYGVCKND